jgi:hypothetical protein
MTVQNQQKGLLRRNFLKLGGAGLLSLPFVAKTKLASGALLPGIRKNYWKGPEGAQYCVQKTVHTGDMGSNVIWARVDKMWRRFQIRDLEQTFWDWNFAERIKRYDAQLSPDWQTNKVFLAGTPHTPSIATYGNARGRGDSAFHLNNKFVALGLAPKEEYIKEINAKMKEFFETHQSYIAYFKEIHSDQNLWRKDRQVGTEVFTRPDSETHTFLNLMENPVVNMAFQGGYDIFKSYELRCIGRVVHLRDPNASEYDKDLVLFNAYQFAGHAVSNPEEIYDIPGVIYYHIEEFDNSIATMGGTRLVKTIGQKLKNAFA